MRQFSSVKFFLSALIVLTFSVFSLSATPAHSDDTATTKKKYDTGVIAPSVGVSIIGQNFTAIPVDPADVTFCCDGCGSGGSGGVSCTGCTGGGGPVSCPGGTFTVTCRDDLQGCPAE